MKVLKFFSIILFILNIVCPVLVLQLVITIGEYEIFFFPGMMRYMWIEYLFIPIPLLSIIVGLILKKHNQKYMKNFVVAAICLFILLSTGSLTKSNSNTCLYNTDRINVIEQKVHVDLPDQIKIGTLVQDDYDISFVKITSDESIEKFELSIENNILWKKELSSKFAGLLPFEIKNRLEEFEYFMVYNVNTAEYNTFPTDGEYKFIVISYDTFLKKLIILEDFTMNFN